MARSQAGGTPNNPATPLQDRACRTAAPYSNKVYVAAAHQVVSPRQPAVQLHMQHPRRAALILKLQVFVPVRRLHSSRGPGWASWGLSTGRDAGSAAHRRRRARRRTAAAALVPHLVYAGSASLLILLAGARHRDSGENGLVRKQGMNACGQEAGSRKPIACLVRTRGFLGNTGPFGVGCDSAVSPIPPTVP